MKFKWSLRIASTIATCAIVLITPQLASSQSAQTQLPAVARSCINSTFVARYSLIATTQVAGETFYLLETFERGETAPEFADTLVISVANQRCQERYFDPSGEGGPLSSAIPQAAARQLTLQAYQREIAQVGRSQVQQTINDLAADAQGAVTWPDEEVWAIRQLGLRLPANVRVTPQSGGRQR